MVCGVVDWLHFDGITAKIMGGFTAVTLTDAARRKLRQGFALEGRLVAFRSSATTPTIYLRSCGERLYL
jgi:hypothetical protein